MSHGLVYFSGLALLALLASAAADCDFQPECRPGESYRLAIPCEGKCTSFVECSNGAAAEKKCGKYFFTTKNFDHVKLECVRDSVDCDWWKKVPTTTTAAPPASTSTPAPETTASTPTTETTPSTSTEASTTAAADTTAQPSTTAAPSTSTPPPPAPTPDPAESAAAPLAAAWPAVLAAAVALML